MAFVGDQEASSFSTAKCPYRVFLSFRGVDTRLIFTGHLYTALMNAGIKTFKDDIEITRGETIKSELERGIQQSRASLIVFSKDYANSRWCLDELAMILEHRKASGHLVLPLFYHVEPTDVRRQTGSIGKAFAKYEKKVRREANREKKNKLVQDIKRWRAALKEAADISGMELKIEANGDESKFVQKIVTLVQNKFSRKILYVAPYLVGMTSRTRDIDLWIRDPTADASIMVISGMDGIGKTTIAKHIFNENYKSFSGYSFLSDIRERSKDYKGLIDLQKQLLLDICKRKKEEIYNVDEGIIKIGEAIGCKRILLVFDDVDHVDQLTSVFRMQGNLYPGSKIIITTKNKWVTNAYGACKVHEVETLSYDESFQLFKFHAFPHGPQFYSELAKKIVDRCGGLPLALQILGSTLVGAKLDVWAGVLKKLETIPHGDIIKKLMISFDSLPDDDVKNIFLHIACFFTGENKNLTIKILDACDMHATVGINILVNGCLLEIDYLGALTLHPLIKDMGRYIVQEESPEPGKRSRLWPSQDCFDVLRRKTGTRKVKALAFDMQIEKNSNHLALESIPEGTNGHKRNFEEPSVLNNSVKRHASNFHSWQSKDNKERYSNDTEIDADTFTRMEQLMFLKLNNVEFTGCYKKFPQWLRCLCWHRCHFECIPDDLYLSSLVFLDMQHSRLKQLWEGAKSLPALKFLNLSYSLMFDKSPDFSELTNLEMLILKGCTQLGEVSETIKFAKGLVLLDFKDCKGLTKLPGNIRKLNSLGKLNISGCSSLKELPMGLRNMKSIKVFLAERIDMNALVSLGKGSTSIASFPHYIRKLSLKNCKLTNDSFPKDLSKLTLLKALNLGGNLLTSLPDCFHSFTKLETLNLSDCPELQSILGLPTTLKTFLSRDFKKYPEQKYGRYVQCHNCPKLLELEGCYKRARGRNVDRRIMKYLGLEATLTDLSVFQEIEVKFEYGIFSGWVRGVELPPWFSCKSQGSTISFTVLDKPDKIRGLTMGFVFVRGYEYSWPLLIFHNQTRNCKWNYTVEYKLHDYEKGENMVWLSYWNKFGEAVKARDEVTISIACFGKHEIVKEIGMTIVYDEEEEGYNDFDHDKMLTNQLLTDTRLSLSDQTFVHYSDFNTINNLVWATLSSYHSYESEENTSSYSSDECGSYNSLSDESENESDYSSDGRGDGSDSLFLDESDSLDGPEGMRYNSENE